MMVATNPVPAHRDLFRRRTHDLRNYHRPGNVRFTWNARGALFQLLAALPQHGGRTVLVPAFHCMALVKPIVAAGFAVAFYRIRPDLTIDVEDLSARLQPDVAAVLVIHYFGFSVDLDGVEALVGRHGALLIEDCSHSFLTCDQGRPLGQRGHFAVFSYYKCVPSVVGGALVANGETPLPAVSSVGAAWPVQLAVLHRWLKQAGGRTPKRGVRILLRILDGLSRRGLTASGLKSGSGTKAASKALPPRGFLNDPYLFEPSLARAALPWHAQRIVESSSWDSIAHLRRRNYAALSRLIPDSPRLVRLIPELPEGVVPYMFPVCLRNRERHEQALREAGIPFMRFGETLHPDLERAGAVARRDAKDLSATLILLPVHQDLSERRIEEYVTLLLDYVGRIAPED